MCVAMEVKCTEHKCHIHIFSSCMQKLGGDSSTISILGAVLGILVVLMLCVVGVCVPIVVCKYRGKRSQNNLTERYNIDTTAATL